jgi:hypothetical protein
MMGERWDVSVDVEASEEEVEAVDAAFRDVGLSVEVRASYVRKSVGLLPWIVLIVLPLKGFLEQLGREAATDTYAALKRLVARIREARQGNEGSIVVEDPESSTTLVIGEDLPDEAYIGLYKMDPEDYEGAYLLWDPDRGEWKDATPGK